MMAIETKAEPRVLLHHSDINSQGVCTTLSGTPFIQCRALGLPNSHGGYTSLYKTRSFS